MTEDLMQEYRDLVRVANATGMVRRCPGGRPVLDGYVCLHCGNDFEDNKKCPQPRNEQRTTGV